MVDGTSGSGRRLGAISMQFVANCVVIGSGGTRNVKMRSMMASMKWNFYVECYPVGILGRTEKEQVVVS